MVESNRLTRCAIFAIALAVFGVVAVRTSPAAPAAPVPAAPKPRLVSALPLYELEEWGEHDLRSLLAAGPGGRIEAGEAYACTCFSARYPDGARIMGRNFDWRPNPALVLVSRPPSGYASISLVDISYLGYGPSRSPIDDPAGLAAAWRLPFDGMNEKGLAVGQMAVPSADGGPGKERPLIGSLGIIRVLLDRTADVGEALALMEGYDVLFDEVPLHYLVADASGAAAVVEYLDGRPRVLRSGKDWAVATNFAISSTPPGARDRACGRYALAGASLGPSGGLLRGEDEAFGLLGRLAQANTRWSAIYELGPRRLRLALGRDYRRIYGWRL